MWMRRWLVAAGIYNIAWGAAMVLAPEHPLVEKITTPAQREAVRAYVATAANKSDMDRTAETKKKTGVFPGAYAINHVNEEKIPVWVADYVLMTYGTGASENESYPAVLAQLVNEFVAGSNDPFVPADFTAADLFVIA